MDVGAQTSGKLKLLKVVRGDHVAKDALLGEIDPDLAATALASADAALAAQIKEAAAGVSTARSNLGFTRITAPMAGEVVSISLLEGQTLNANQSATWSSSTSCSTSPTPTRR